MRAVVGIKVEGTSIPLTIRLFPNRLVRLQNLATGLYNVQLQRGVATNAKGSCDNSSAYA